MTEKFSSAKAWSRAHWSQQVALACSVSDETNNKAEGAIGICFNRFSHHLISGEKGRLH